MSKLDAMRTQGIWIGSSYLTEALDLQALRDTRNSCIKTEYPPASMLAVKRLVREEYLIKVEAMAVVSE